MKAKTCRISAKCSDLCSVELRDAKGTVIAEHQGYVPDFTPEEHYGDYVILDIDLATGKILNWKPPTEADLKRPTNQSDWTIPGSEKPESDWPATR